MNILQQPDNLSFSSMIKDIIIASEEKLKISYRYAGNDPFLEETYVPDNDGKIYILELDKLLTPYLPEDTRRGTFSISIVDESDSSQEITFEIIYCTAEINVDPQEFIESNFLTTILREKLTYPDQNEFISLYRSDSDTQLKAIATYVDGKQVMKTTTLKAPNGLQTINVSPGVLFSNVENILYYVVSCGSRAITFYLLPELPEAAPQFVFINSFGVQETFIPSGLISRENKYDTAFGFMSGLYRKYKNNLVKQHTVNTGILDDNTANWIEDLFLSKDVALLSAAGETKAIVIEESTVKRSSAYDELPAFEFKYRLAKKNHNEYRAGKLRIFDYTFDYTFN